jgi:fructokinase
MNPIVGIGELLWDVFPDGRKVAGGAPFNFAFHCKQLGHDAVIVSRVGDDELGRELRAEVRRLGLPDEFIQTDPDHPTGTTQVTVDERGQPTYTITEDVAWDYIGWDRRLAERVPVTSAICFGSLAQRGPVSRETIRRVIAEDVGLVGERSLRVFDLNLRDPYYDTGLIEQYLESYNWLKLSAEELAELRHPFGLDGSEDVTGAIDLRDRFGLGQVCLTLGQNGCFIALNGGDITEPGVPARVVDTVGAGDAFTAAMVCLHLEGRPLRECARFANHYAARVCEFQGATPTIDRADVERAAFG